MSVLIATRRRSCRDRQARPPPGATVESAIARKLPMTVCPTYAALIDAMVDTMVAQYLTCDTAPQSRSSPERPDPVPLPNLSEAT
jgi:hypothetical protein